EHFAPRANYRYERVAAHAARGKHRADFGATHRATLLAHVTILGGDDPVVLVFLRVAVLDAGARQVENQSASLARRRARCSAADLDIRIERAAATVENQALDIRHVGPFGELHAVDEHANLAARKLRELRFAFRRLHLAVHDGARDAGCLEALQRELGGCHEMAGHDRLAATGVPAPRRIGAQALLGIGLDAPRIAMLLFVVARAELAHDARAAVLCLDHVDHFERHEIAVAHEVARLGTDDHSVEQI